MSKEKKNAAERATDAASVALIQKSFSECISTCFSRLDEQGTQCRFGLDGICCKICSMGPCRIAGRSAKGVCGADRDTIAARNFLRQVAGGAAAHSDHGRHLVLLLRAVARGQTADFMLRDEKALFEAAAKYGIDPKGRTREQVADALADACMGEFSSEEKSLHTLRLAPLSRRATWKKCGVGPLGIDRMIVEAMHRTTMGVDHDYRNLLLHAFRTALADGWGGSRLATMATDILFQAPAPVQSTANLGVLKRETVNVVVHGHEPALSEALVAASSDPDVLAKAQSAGASGITLAGICCTANEILMRHGIPVAGNFLQQELALLTGAVELMITDVQCCMPSLAGVAKSFHTEVISTSDIAKTIGATHQVFDSSHALEIAKRLLLCAVENFRRRDVRKIAIPGVSRPLVAGFSIPAVKRMMGGTFRASFRPLNDAIIQGRIKDIAGIVGCNNPKMQLDAYTLALARELLGQNVLIAVTGCTAIGSAKGGLLTPEAALQYAGPGLREVCEAVGMPPILHMGSCVDNSRLLETVTEIISEGGLGEDLSDVPVLGVAPEWMSEKAMTIGCYFVASGVDVILGHAFPVAGSANVTKYLCEEAEGLFGACFHVCEKPHEAAMLILEILDRRRERLGIHKKVERKLMGMDDRRKIHG